MSARKIITKKTRPEAFELRDALSPEQQSALQSFLDSHTYEQAIPWAKKQFGLVIAAGALHRFYHKHDALKVLSVIASGAAMNRKLDAAYEQNPAPDFARLVQLFKTLILDFSINGANEPGKLELANALFKSALDYLKEQGKQEDRALNERKVVLLEKKAAQADATEQVLGDAKLSPAERAARIKEIYGR